MAVVLSMRPVGTFSVRIEVGDPAGRRFEAIEAIVDTGATRTTIPASVLHALGVDPYRKASFRLADGRMRELGLGRTRVRVDGREELTQVAFGEEGMPCLLGAITLEELDLAVDPVNKRLVPTAGLLLHRTQRDAAPRRYFSVSVSA